MSFDHDVYDDPPLDASEMAATKPNVIGPIGRQLSLRVNNFQTLFTRGTLNPPGDDKTYD